MFVPAWNIPKCHLKPKTDSFIQLVIRKHCRWGYFDNKDPEHAALHLQVYLFSSFPQQNFKTSLPSSWCASEPACKPIIFSVDSTKWCQIPLLASPNNWQGIEGEHHLLLPCLLPSSQPSSLFWVSFPPASSHIQ